MPRYWTWVAVVVGITVATVVVSNHVMLFHGSFPLHPADITVEHETTYKAVLSHRETHGIFLESRLESWEWSVRTMMRLSEDGRPLSATPRSLFVVRELGKGAYTHWGPIVVFSASDNTDPRTNGRTYTVTYPLLFRESVQELLLIGCCILLLLWLVDIGTVGRRRVLAWILDGMTWLRQSQTGWQCIRLGATCVVVTMGFAVNRTVLEESASLPTLAPDTLSYLDWYSARTPGYPVFLRTLAFLGLDMRWLVPIQLNLLLVSFAFLGAALTALWGSYVVGGLVTASLFCSLPLLLTATEALSESLFITTMCFHLGCVLFLLHGQRVGWALMAGLSAGAAVAVRPTGYAILVCFPALIMMVRERRLKLASYLLGGTAGILLATVAAQYERHMTFSLQTFGGMSFLGYVAPVVTEDLSNGYPELTKAIAQRIEPLVHGLDQPMGRAEHWLKTTESFNPVLWGNIAPTVDSYVARTYPELKGVQRWSTSNDIALAIAMSAMWARLDWYIPHVATHYSTVWDLADTGPDMFSIRLNIGRRSSIQVITDNPSLADLTPKAWYEYANRALPPAIEPSAWLQALGERLSSSRWWGVDIALVASYLCIGAVLLGRVQTNRAKGLAYTAMLLQAYTVLVVLVQPIILRYIDPIRPLIIVESIGSAAIVFAWGAAQIHSHWPALVHRVGWGRTKGQTPSRKSI